MYNHNNVKLCNQQLYCCNLNKVTYAYSQLPISVQRQNISDTILKSTVIKH